MSCQAGELLNIQREFYRSGKTYSYPFRLAALQRLQNAVRKKEAAILAALKEDLGKGTTESYMTEVGFVLEELSFCIRHLKGWMRPRRVRTPLPLFPGRCRIYPEPLGVALILSPWNYPFQLCMAPLIGAIAAGCCAVVKPSELAPATAAVVKELLDGIFDSRHIRTILGGREETAALWSQPFDLIFFTGGERVGKMVMAAAAQNLTPVVLELGGKSPCIVERTADLRLAARRICFGKLLNAGQTCVAPDYVLAQASIREPLIQELKKAMRDMLGEEPLTAPDYPHIISRGHFDRLTGLMQGQRLLYGGETDPIGRRIAPALIDRPAPDAPVMQEEIFGPLLPVLSFDDLSDALRFVAERPRPLALYLFTEDKRSEKTVLQTLSFGGGCVNDTVMHLVTPHMGFGGVGTSGMGDYHGKRSFDAFTHYKSMLHQSTGMDPAIRYRPYTEKHARTLRRLMK